MKDEEKEDLFTKLGLEVKFSGEIIVGQTYPLYGMITEVFEYNKPLNTLKVVLNFDILLDLYGLTEEKVELIKTRSFEPGIFVSEILKDNKNTESKYSYEGSCKTVVFGKQQNKMEM